MPHGVHVLQVDHDDWVVKQEGGRELGHYPDRSQAETVGRKIAQRRNVELLVHGSSGAIEHRSRPSRGWFTRLFNR
jgi:calcineurin-like phosphoesterase family protein